MASLSFVASAISNVETITIPAGAQANTDVAVLFDVAQNLSSDPGDVIPTGWDGIVTDFASSRRIRVSRKILQGGDPGAVIAGMVSDIRQDKVMFVFRGDAALSSVTPSTWLTEITTGDPASQVISASGQATPLLVLAVSWVGGATAAFSTASPAFDATVATGSADMLAGYKIYNSSPANHTVDMADLGTNILASGYLLAAMASGSFPFRPNPMLPLLVR